MLKHNGFSLVEIMIAMGLLGLVSLGVMQIMSNSSNVISNLESKTEEIDVLNQIKVTLSSKSACSQTLVLPSVSIGSNFNEIKNRNGDISFEVGGIYGNRKIRLASLRVENVNVPATGGLGAVEIRATLERLRKENNKNIVKAFTLKVKAPSSNGPVQECYQDSAGTIETALNKSCESIDGVWNKPTGRCELNCTENSNHAAISTSCFNETVDNELDERYVLKDGDIMTGSLGVQGDVTSEKFCVGSNCRDFTAQACSPGSLVKSINPDGSLNCTEIKCDPNKYFEGLDSTGNIVCKALPTKTCPTDQYVTKVNVNGTVECAPLPSWTAKDCPGGAITKIDSSGTAHCTKLPNNKSCSDGKFMTGIDTDGNLICDRMDIEVKTRTASCTIPTTSEGSDCTAVAECLSSEIVVGGGCSMGGHHTKIQRINPAGNGYRCVIRNFEDATTRYSVTAYAKCLKK